MGSLQEALSYFGRLKRTESSPLRRKLGAVDDLLRGKEIDCVYGLPRCNGQDEVDDLLAAMYPGSGNGKGADLRSNNEKFFPVLMQSRLQDPYCCLTETGSDAWLGWQLLLGDIDLRRRCVFEESLPIYDVRKREGEVALTLVEDHEEVLYMFRSNGEKRWVSPSGLAKVNLARLDEAQGITERRRALELEPRRPADTALSIISPVAVATYEVDGHTQFVFDRYRGVRRSLVGEAQLAAGIAFWVRGADTIRGGERLFEAR